MANLTDHLIPSQACQILVEEYDNTIYRENNRMRPSSKPDSKRYSIDLEVLQDYLKLISTEMDKKGVLKKGVQINLGKYPDQSNDPKLKSAYRGYQMVFFSPVDLEHPSHGRNPGEEEDEGTNLAGLPNLNYMNLCPPNQKTDDLE